MLIALDAGHGRNTAGKRTPDGIREWVLNSEVCNYIAQDLWAYDCEILRLDDTTGATDVPLLTRRNKAIQAGANVLVSIHHNAVGETWTNATGTEVYVARNTQTASIQLAEIIARNLSKETRLRDRGVKKASFTIINTTRIPAILCEGGFMDGTHDSFVIRTEKGQRAYAKAVTDGLIQFFGIKVKEDADMTYEQFTSFMERYKKEHTYKYVKDMPTWGQEAATLAIKDGTIAMDQDGAVNVPEVNLQPLEWMRRRGLFNK